MKKIALLLALIMILGTAFLAACGEKETNNNTGGTTTEAVDKGTTTTTAQRETPPIVGDDDDDDDDDEAEPFADASRFTVDGAFGEGEWDGIKTVAVVGEEGADHNSGNKSATFYAAVTESGLYLACDAYHDEYTSGNTAGWWFNSNFEFFIGSGSNQYFVYADGMENPCLMSTNVDEAAMTTVVSGAGTMYHTITEAFISSDNLPTDILYLNTYSIGVAWKTVGDLIIGGAATAGTDKSDEYWVPLGTWPNNPSLVAAPSGLYFGDDYWEE